MPPPSERRRPDEANPASGLATAAHIFLLQPRSFSPDLRVRGLSPFVYGAQWFLLSLDVRTVENPNYHHHPFFVARRIALGTNDGDPVERHSG